MYSTVPPCLFRHGTAQRLRCARFADDFAAAIKSSFRRNTIVLQEKMMTSQRKRAAKRLPKSLVCPITGAPVPLVAGRWWSGTDPAPPPRGACSQKAPLSAWWGLPDLFSVVAFSNHVLLYRPFAVCQGGKRGNGAIFALKRSKYPPPWRRFGWRRTGAAYRQSGSPRPRR